MIEPHVHFAPSRSEGALGPYLRAIRAHRLLVAAITLLTVLAALAWLAQRTPEYEAQAEILINPVPQDDTTFLGIQILRDAPADPTRAVQTAATLIESPLAAREAAERLGDDWTRTKVERAVEVNGLGETNVLAVTARADDADEAAEVANEFARAALEVRTNGLREQIRTTLAELETRRRAVRRDPAASADLAARINALESVLAGDDPTLSLLQPATPPSGAVGAPSALILALALIAGLILATGTALLMEMLDRRIRDTDELLSLYPLPVLARVPALPRKLRRKADVPADPSTLPPAVREGYRTLLVQLEQQPTKPRTIMMTSASTGDGKTSSAVNFAFSLVGAGHRVILIDFDLRKPDVAKTLGAESERGLVSLLASDTSLPDLLVPAPKVPSLRLVPAGTDGDVVLLEALTRRLPEVLKEAEDLADYVILDTAPLGEVSDALRMADEVDGIIIVTRPGHTNRENFEFMRDLLQQTGKTPLGYVTIGA